MSSHHHGSFGDERRLSSSTAVDSTHTETLHRGSQLSLLPSFSCKEIFLFFISDLNFDINARREAKGKKNSKEIRARILNLFAYYTMGFEGVVGWMEREDDDTGCGCRYICHLVKHHR